MKGKDFTDKQRNYAYFFPSLNILLTTIWLSNDQFWAILKGVASLTQC